MGAVDGAKDWLAHVTVSKMDRMVKGQLYTAPASYLQHVLSVSCSNRVVRGPCVQFLCQFLPPGTCFLSSAVLFRQFPAPTHFFLQPGSLPLRLLPVTSCKSLPLDLPVFFRLFSSHFLPCYRHPRSLPQVLCQFLLTVPSSLSVPPSSFQQGPIPPVTLLQVIPSTFLSLVFVEIGN